MSVAAQQPETELQSEEARRAPRIRSFLRGEITLANGAIRTECVVRDISETGAKLQVSAAINIPEHFDLFIPQRNRREKARLMWRHAEELGVTFAPRASDIASISAPRGGGFADDGRVADLETQVQQLRQQLATMRAMVEHLMKDRG